MECRARVCFVSVGAVSRLIQSCSLRLCDLQTSESSEMTLWPRVKWRKEWKGHWCWTTRSLTLATSLKWIELSGDWRSSGGGGLVESPTTQLHSAVFRQLSAIDAWLFLFLNMLLILWQTAGDIRSNVYHPHANYLLSMSEDGLHEGARPCSWLVTSLNSR